MAGEISTVARRRRTLMRFWTALRLLGLAVLALSLGSSVEAAPIPPPNIVVILADDMPALDGRLVDQLPVIRRVFEEQGTTFADFHSETPLCCPARAGFLTGQHTDHHGVTRNVAKLFNPKMTIATQLHGVGYYTIIVGKYLNLYGRIAGSFAPGWDKFLVFGDPGYYNYDLYGNANPVPMERHESLPTDYSTDVLARRAVRFLGSAPAGKPLFAWISAYAPHDPTTPAPRYETASCMTAPWKPPDWNEADVSDKPLYVRALPLLTTPPFTFRQECQSLLAVDDLVAAVRAELAAEGRLGNTLLVFVGDNGMHGGEHRLKLKSAPYRTDTPFYISWLARLGSSPRTVSERIQNIDLAPTLCAVAGCRLGPYPGGQASPDGTSFLCLLERTCTTLGRDAVLDDLPSGKGSLGLPPWYAVVTTSISKLGLWHYVEYASGEKELYDLANGPCWLWVPGSSGDPCELQNKAGNPRYATVQAALAKRLAELKAARPMRAGTG
jgi:N-acetylglucosamine-6-sulfatase